MSNGYDSTEAFLSGIERELKADGSSATRSYDRSDRDSDRHGDRDRERRRRRYDEDDDRSRRRRGYEDEDEGGDGRRGGARRDYGYDRRETEYRRRDDYHRDRDGYRGSGGGGGSRRDGYGYDYRGGDRYDDHRYGRRDDRRGHGGAGGGSSWRDGPAADAGQAVRRSPTPPGTRPISERLRPNSKWNVAPPGYEATTPMQAKATGLFGVPGQSRSLGVPGPGHSSMMMGSTASAIEMSSMAGLPQNSRQSRRLYVGNISGDTTDVQLCAFFNEQMRRNNFVTEEGDPAIAAQVNSEKGYAFLEFRSAHEATSAMSFDGIIFQGQSVKIRRPKDYIGPDANLPMASHVPGLISTNVPDGPNKIYIGGLPTYLKEEEVMELLKSFGDLRSFNLVRESGVNGASKGFAFCEYVDPSRTDLAIQGLHDMEVSEKRLLVQRASVGSTGQRPLASALPPPMTGANSAALAAPSSSDGPGEPTRAMMLLNCVTAEELLDAQEYQEIVEDMRDECAKYGRVVDMRIPRPLAASKASAAQTWKRTQDGEPIVEGGGGAKEKEREGVGRVYVLFEDTDSCRAALQAIAGRQFAQRTVIAAFIAEDAFPADEDGGRDAAETSMQALS